MKRLYKIIILFVIIFLVGIYYSFKSIDTAFSSDDKTETILVKLPSSKNLIQVLY